MEITAKQRKEILALRLVKPEEYENFFDILEGDLSHNHILKRQQIGSNLKEQKKTVDKLIQTAKKLLDLLNDSSATTVQTSASRRIAGLGKQSNYRWSTDLASKCVSAILDEAIIKKDDLRESVGTRYKEQSLMELLSFWIDYMKQSIRPITPNGLFVKFSSIVLSQDSETTCRAIQRLLEKQPELAFVLTDTTKPTKN
jgi:parvulin-like peptidyl-prolyl isomerase